MEFMLRHFLEAFPSLPRKDNQRSFTHVQRLAIFRRDKGHCQLKIKCDGAKVFGALNDAASDEKAVALGKREAAKADKAQLDAEAAQRALSAAEKSLLSALSSALLDDSKKAKRDQLIAAAQAKVNVARTAMEKANQAADATLRLAIIRNKGGLFEGPGLEKPFELIGFTTGLKAWGDSVGLGLLE